MINGWYHLYKVDAELHIHIMSKYYKITCKFQGKKIKNVTL